ncbi:MAG: T9SS type A sorting domain-containing protein, partial [Bacteroidota bacterium]|nr:T9SS type A sorting domain-containing protein [Bacteroidota bacterium]
SFEDGSAGPLVRNAVLDNWKLEGANAAGDNSAIIQTTNVHDGDGSNALEVTNLASAGEWNNKVTSTTYPFDGDGINPIDVTISFWAKTTDTDPVSGNANGDLKLIVRDAVSASDKSNRAILATDGWVFITKTFSFPAATNYSLSLSIQFGRLEGVTQIDGITSSVSGGATLATQDILINDSSIFIYPNPVKNVLSYNTEGVKNIEVYNLLGQKLIEEKAVGSLNTSAFSKGSYLLKLLGENGSVSTARFIKE